jgi:hypothetical protein
MAHGGCPSLISCYSSTKLQWAKYFLRTGKFTQSKANGLARLMGDAAL